MTELVSNDRIIGGITPACSSRARELYKLVVEGNCIETNCRTAELAKLAENSFRDVNIAFANELSIICDDLDISVWELIRLANRHPRVNILQPGPGVGGHCIAVDPWFIVAEAPGSAKIIRQAREVNDGKPEWVVNKVKSAVEVIQKLHGKTARIACFGLTFKPNIDDLRESPALEIVERLNSIFPEQIDIVEPFIDNLPSHLKDTCTLTDASIALETADLAVMLVDHNEFKAMPVPRRPNLKLIDTRGLWSPT